MNRRAIGQTAEDEAARFLVEKGMVIVDRNFNLFGGEIDIIAHDKDELVFVEVRSLHEDPEISIYEVLGNAKKHKLLSSINRWLARSGVQSRKWRVDFVGIVFDNANKPTQIEHFPNIEL